MSYAPPLRDIEFAIREWLAAPQEWSAIPGLSALDWNTAEQIIAEAGRFVTTWLEPINAEGDTLGCVFADGRVATPPGFRAAYEAYVAAGWSSLACSSEQGGQGLPLLLNTVLFELMNSANHAFTMFPGLAHGAYECLRTNASPGLRAHFLPKIVSGEWLATMCLTEAHAGSDLSLLRTRALPAPEGSALAVAAGEAVADAPFFITGTKIFISGGAHDLTDNIVHLVLARSSDAPPGTKGLSLFLVPQRVAAGVENAVFCERIEHKMGIRASPTCVLRFEDAVGWLVGEPHRGLAAMFVMMNAARIMVGIQGLAHTETSYQQARGYALQRRQMRAVSVRDRDAPADLIVAHPPIRRILHELRATAEAERAVAYWASHLLDLAEHHPDRDRRRACLALCSVLTPVIKATFTEHGFALSSQALQVFGGSGYIKDHGIEQTVRDSRIAMIYEGTNEIQAVDLLVRKILGDAGPAFRLLLDTFEEEAARCRDVEGCGDWAERLAAGCSKLDACIERIRLCARADPEAPYRAADDFMRACGILLLAFAWARSARVAHAAAASSVFHADKRATARFYFDYRLPELDHRLALVDVACRGLDPIRSTGP